MTAATPAPAGLDELDALLAAATPGEWEHITDYHQRGIVDESIWAATGPDDGYYISERVVSAADAALIVALRNRAPAMLAAIHAAYALAEELERDAAMLEPDHGYRYTDSASRLRTTLDEALGVEK